MALSIFLKTQRFLSLLIALVLAAGLSAAQDGATEPSEREKQLQKVQSQQELEALQQQIGVSEEALARLTGEIATLEKDQETLRNALVKAAAAQRRLGADIAKRERRLEELGDEQSTLRASLTARRGLLGEVLAALQRMGRSPPPALLVTPDDALAAVRSAILLGAVVPEIRDDTKELVADLQALSRITQTLSMERAEMLTTMERQVEEERKVALLLEEKDKLQTVNRQELNKEQQRSGDLAEKAQSLEDLIDALQLEIAKAETESERRRLEAEARQRRIDERREAGRKMIEEKPEPERMAPLRAFSSLKGSVPLPVNGFVTNTFGERDNFGQVASGITLQTRGKDLVTAPADGWVLYAGPFRSYGQLLILDAGNDYHLVLAGMEAINVRQGQFVVAGEPVASMGETKFASAAALALDSSGPTLYMEFRKDGKSIDPRPFLADDPPERNNNDS